MTMSARNRGAAGVVINGWSRDTPGILAVRFPCFSRGRYAQDQRTRGTVVDFRCPVRIGSVDIRPGDAIFGDMDGVVVIPREQVGHQGRRRRARVPHRHAADARANVHDGGARQARIGIRTSESAPPSVAGGHLVAAQEAPAALAS
jgi:regulator of RNase E activity RraA